VEKIEAGLKILTGTIWNESGIGLAACLRVSTDGCKVTYHHICVAAFDLGLLWACVLSLGQHAPAALRLWLKLIRPQAPNSGHAQLYQEIDCACDVRWGASWTLAERLGSASRLCRRLHPSPQAPCRWLCWVALAGFARVRQEPRCRCGGGDRR
jgi:hypothetical protein